MMNQFCLATVMAVGFFFSQGWGQLDAPIRSDVSEKVAVFLNGQERMNANKIVASQYDVLGRSKETKSSFYFAVDSSERKMDVRVIYLDFPEDSTTSFARYENEKGRETFFLNGEKIEREDYFKTVDVDKPFIPVGFFASLTAKEIKALLQGERRVYITEPFKYQNEMVYTGILSQGQISTHAHSNGYDGSGISIYLTEIGCPKTSMINTGHYVSHRNCSNQMSAHATAMTRIIQTTAPGVDIHLFEAGDYSDVANDIYDVASLSLSSTSDSTYSWDDFQLDNLVYQNGIISFVAAGNHNFSTDDYFVTSPGKALNVITVGAVNPVNNSFDAITRWKNSNVGNQKPEILNYTDFRFPYDVNFYDDNGSYYSGFAPATSSATAYTAGFMADVLHQHPFFRRHPEMVKALLITGSTVPVSGYSQDSDNGTLAARGLPVYSSLAWNTRSVYWNGSNSDFFVGDSISFTESGIVSGTRYRIAISWLNPAGYVRSDKKCAQDLNLYIYQGNNLVASSVSSKNPFEVVDFTTHSNADLRVVIKRAYNSGTANVKLGYNMWIEN